MNNMHRPHARNEETDGGVTARVSQGSAGAWLRLGVLLCALTALPAHASVAYWTGAQRMITTMSGAPGVACEYNFQGRTFWQVFSGFSCPLSVQVQ